MSNSEKIRGEISFSGTDGQKSTDFIQAVRAKAFDENKIDDPDYMVDLTSLCLTGLALEWFEGLSDEVQNDWSLLRRALLGRFPALEDNSKVELSFLLLGEIPSQTLIFAGDNPKEVEEFVRRVRRHSHVEGRFKDDQWMASYAASCMAGTSFKWHAKLEGSTRNSWIRLEHALVEHFPEPPPHALAPAENILVKNWEPMQAPSFFPTSEEVWLREARQRRSMYDKAGQNGLPSIHWLLVESGAPLPQDAILTGTEPNGCNLYTARTWYEGGLHPGKVGQNWRGPIITWGDKEHLAAKSYEVLVGDASLVQWVRNPCTPKGTAGPPSIQMKSFRAVEGGRESNGLALFLVQAFREECGWQPGKIRAGSKECPIGWQGDTLRLENFNVLVWAE